MKVAVVHEWLTNNGGSEKVVEEILKIFPQAVLYTSVYDKNKIQGFYTTDIRTTSLQKIPIIKYKHKLMSYFRAVFFETLDLSEYDLVIISSHAEAKGVITRPKCKTVAYCHTPTRYYWSDYIEYKNYMEFGLLNPIMKVVFPLMSSYMRLWDRSAADRVDKFIANSNDVKLRIKKYYRKDSQVIYPPVDTQFFSYNDQVKRGEFYVTSGRLIPYKKTDIVVDAFSKSGKELYVIGDGPLKKSLMKKYKNYHNIHFVGFVTKEKLREYYQSAKGFVFCSKEDFGIVMVEALSCGCPVIAYNQGGARDIVREEQTGIFFEQQTVESINKAIEHFEKIKIDSEACRERSEIFSTENFKTQFRQAVLSS